MESSAVHESENGLPTVIFMKAVSVHAIPGFTISVVK